MAATNEELADLWLFVEAQRNAFIKAIENSVLEGNMFDAQKRCYTLMANTLADTMDEIHKMIKE